MGAFFVVIGLILTPMTAMSQENMRQDNVTVSNSLLSKMEAMLNHLDTLRHEIEQLKSNGLADKQDVKLSDEQQKAQKFESILKKLQSELNHMAQENPNLILVAPSF